MPRTPRSQPDQGEPAASSQGYPIRIVVREDADVEVRFVNHILANFNGTEFVMTLAQAIPPLQREGPEWQAFLDGGELQARLVDQVAIPPEKFIEMTAAFAELIERLRGAGALPRKGESNHDDAR